MIKFLLTEVGYGIACSLVIILLTHFLKKIFKSAAIRKKYTPLITLGLSIIASLAFYLTIKSGTLDFGEVQSYITIAAYGMEIAVAATGFYILVKRIFGKVTEEDITIDELFATADKLLPQGLLLISNFIGGDITTAETLYAKVKKEVKEGLEEKSQSISENDIVEKIKILLSGWTNVNSLDIATQAKLLVQSVEAELKVEKAEKVEELKKEENKE